MSIIQVLGTLFDASFGGTNLSTKDFYCYDIEKPLMPKQEESLINIPKMPGLIQSSKKFTENKLILLGYMNCDDYDDLISKIETLSGFLYADEDKQLISSKQTDRYWNVQYLDYDILSLRDTYALVNLLFKANDPFAYDITPDSDDQTITVVDDTYSITNNGHYYAYPVITITFNQVQSHIYIENNSITDNRFDISKSFEVNDELEIDCKNKTIKLNGSNSPVGFGDGGEGLAEFILFAKGGNTIAVGTDDETIDIDINTTFNKPYFY